MPLILQTISWKTYAPLGHYLKFTVDMFYNQYLFKDNLTDSMISLGYDEDIRFSQIPQKIFFWA